MPKKKVLVVGAGFGGLTVSALLAQKGWDVTVVERHSTPGGRARVWEQEGYCFDMGPSWYLMPEVFEEFFHLFGKERKEYYELEKLDPYYQVIFGNGERVTITPDLEQTLQTFESFEPGGAKRLQEYLTQAQYKYEVAMRDFLYRDYRTVWDFFNRKLLIEGSRLGVFYSLDRFVRKYFRDHRARKILEYAMVFLGASPNNTPGLYSIMSHVDMNLGVYYPKGGIHAIVRGLVKLCEEQGVGFLYDTEVKSILVRNGKGVGVRTSQGEIEADTIVVNADYSHTELKLLPEEYRTFPLSYWEQAVWAPSMFIAYLGTNRRISSLAHHNLYFSDAWDDHFRSIFQDPKWPEEPSFYLSCPSQTDSMVAPKDGENLFFLIPVAPGLPDGEEFRESYFQRMLDKAERILEEKIRPYLRVKRIYSQRDFSSDYHAFRGTALGLSHTLRQTAIFRPPRRSRKVKGLYYTGQYPHPGVGVPSVFICSVITANGIERDLKEEGKRA
ncbi:MAG: phytoene desaturase family protein [Spirochaetes bacterium]|nr:phytoene desaturase family protein [Spirochaetota bacterium]